MTVNSTDENELPQFATQWLNNIDEKTLDIEFIKHACNLTRKINPSLQKNEQEALLKRGITIASQLWPLRCDSETLAAAILYPSFYEKISSKDIITEQLSEKVSKLLAGTQQMEAIDTLQSHFTKFSQRQNQIDNLRKMLLAIVDDIRIVLIKLAERLVNLMALKNSDANALQTAKQAMDLYAPLANRLGIGQFKWKMEDLAFQHINPENYKKISKAIKIQREDREKYIHKVITKIENLLKEHNIQNVMISGRVKHIYSIYRKIQRKQVDLSRIYDASAVRILANDLKDCYAILGIVHNTWQHIPEEFDDYIAKPKPNGYRSIHTAVVGPDNRNVEIQIRTYKMHEESELGVAAHWKYKEDGKKQSSFEDKITWLREVMKWQKELSKDNSEQIATYKSLFEDRVYVFTPNGDILDMKAGATPLDFAYHIHTEIGHHCRGAKVNSVMVPLTQPLRNGDRIEILTTKRGHPSRDWLNPNLGYLKTHQAIAKVKHWFKLEDFQSNFQAGEALWEKTYRQENLTKNELEKVYSKFNFKSVKDLLAAIGAGDISITTVLNRIRTANAPQKTVAQSVLPKTTPPSPPIRPAIKVESVGNLLTQIAQCCQPIPGDNILGYITKGRGISIHQAECYNIVQALEKRPERVITVDWGKDFPKKFPVDLSLTVEDRQGLLRDISNVIATEKIHILRLNTSVDKLKNESTIYITIEIDNLKLLDKIIRELKKIPEVNNVARKRMT